MKWPILSLEIEPDTGRISLRGGGKGIHGHTETRRVHDHVSAQASGQDYQIPQKGKNHHTMRGNTGVRSPWRLLARPIIAGIVADNPSATEAELQQLFDDALPWPRNHNAASFRMWRAECKAQINLRRRRVDYGNNYNHR